MIRVLSINSRKVVRNYMDNAINGRPVAPVQPRTDKPVTPEKPIQPVSNTVKPEVKKEVVKPEVKA